DGVVAVTGHDNGDVLLWGIRWERPQPPRDDLEQPWGGGRAGAGGAGVVARRGWGSDGSPEGKEEAATGAATAAAAAAAAKPQQLCLLRVLNGAHQRPISFLRVCSSGRELLAGDSRGEISRWQCIRLDQLPSVELQQLVSTQL
ncbi:unnamed protein product, partial [Discosporangium mesarthrocarpum]